MVLQVVNETENSKLMLILKEPRLGYSRTNITWTVRCNDCYVTSETQRGDVLDQFLCGIFAAREIVN